MYKLLYKQFVLIFTSKCVVLLKVSRAESHGAYFSSKPTVTGSQKISRQRTSNTYFLFLFYFHFVKGGKDFVILHFILDINKVDKQCLKTKYTSFKGYLESQSVIVDLIIRLDLKWERLPSLFISIYEEKVDALSCVCVCMKGHACRCSYLSVWCQFFRVHYLKKDQDSTPHHPKHLSFIRNIGAPQLNL